MLRYYAIATGLVLTIVVAVTAWSYRDLIRLKIGSTNLRVPPKGAEPLDIHGSSHEAVSGDAPWALSALPDCFRQRAETVGPIAFVRAHVPADMTLVATGTKLVYGPCTISVAGGEASVTRGSDRMRIPPHVQFYRAPGVLALLRSSTKGSELRVYDAVH
ncbi:MAG: hypothetical protein M3N13_10470 [Candidatus Eremiobacteraeota bacterium]|nr:hypothetical protein [Candidatus Eremiobacteraeota bacterium]